MSSESELTSSPTRNLNGCLSHCPSYPVHAPLGKLRLGLQHSQRRRKTHCRWVWNSSSTPTCIKRVVGYDRVEGGVVGETGSKSCTFKLHANLRNIHLNFKELELRKLEAQNSPISDLQQQHATPSLAPDPDPSSRHKIFPPTEHSPNH